MSEEKKMLHLEPKYFGPLWKYVSHDEVTDVDFNGTDLWITDTKNRRKKIENHGVTSDFVNAFSQRVANQVSKPFNKVHNLLEAETDTLRISILHESAAVSGRSICLRKSLAKVRITADGVIRDDYMPRPILNLLANCIMSKMNFVIGGEPGAGKDLSDDTLVPVPVSDKYPSGFAKHGELSIGDMVFTPDGDIATIDYVTESRDLDLYEIEFSDGQIVEASDTHLWKVVDSGARNYVDPFVVDTYITKHNDFVMSQANLREYAYNIAGMGVYSTVTSIADMTGMDVSFVEHMVTVTNMPKKERDEEYYYPLDEVLLLLADFMLWDNNDVKDSYMNELPFRIMSTKELASRVMLEDGSANYAVALPKGVRLPKVDLLLHPYVLGVWLGDAMNYEFPSVSLLGIRVTDVLQMSDREIERYFTYYGLSCKVSKTNNVMTCYGLKHKIQQVFDTDDTRVPFRIPPKYLRSSYEQRLDLLQGLMDRSGEIDVTGRCHLYLDSKGFCDDVLDLIRSLGIHAKVVSASSNPKYCISFVTDLPVFRVTQKASRLPKDTTPDTLWNYIVSVRKVPSKRGRCIHINHPEHMYLVCGYIPTHNTELAKFFTQFIAPEQRVITIEDSPEWHFHEINPLHDCVEMRVNDDFSYAKAIKTCLRQNPKWIMLSEARSVEAKFLIEAWSTGVNGVTTIHTDDIRKIPSRLLNMMANRDDADRLENDIYDFVNVAILVRRKQQLDGTSRRYVDQMGFLYRDENKTNTIMMLVKNGEMVSDTLPDDIAFRLTRAGVDNPFECTRMDALIGNSFTYETIADRQQREEELRVQRELEEQIAFEKQEQLRREEEERAMMIKRQPIVRKPVGRRTL